MRVDNAGKTKLNQWNFQDDRLKVGGRRSHLSIGYLPMECGPSRGRGRPITLGIQGEERGPSGRIPEVVLKLKARPGQTDDLYGLLANSDSIILRIKLIRNLSAKTVSLQFLKRKHCEWSERQKIALLNYIWFWSDYLCFLKYSNITLQKCCKQMCLVLRIYKPGFYKHSS